MGRRAASSMHAAYYTLLSTQIVLQLHNSFSKVDQSKPFYQHNIICIPNYLVVECFPLCLLWNAYSFKITKTILLYTDLTWPSALSINSGKSLITSLSYKRTLLCTYESKIFSYEVNSRRFLKMLILEYLPKVCCWRFPTSLVRLTYNSKSARSG